MSCLHHSPRLPRLPCLINQETSSRDVQAHAEVLPTWPGKNRKIPDDSSTNCRMPQHADMTGSLSHHEMEIDSVFPMKEFSEFFKPERKQRLGTNDIKSIINDSNLDFIDSMSTHTAETASMSDDSWYGEEDDDMDDMDDVMYHYDDYYDDYYGVVYQVPTVKIPTQVPDWKPTSVMLTASISSATNKRVLRVLFDSGGAKTMIHRRVLPKNCQEQPIRTRTQMNTIAGVYTPESLVWLRGIRFPEFDKSRYVEEHKAIVFEGDCSYDVILGSDFLTKVGMNLKFDNGTIEWLGRSISMRAPFDKNEDYMYILDDYLQQMEEEFLGEDWLDSYLSVPILDAKYEKADIDAVIEEQSHLSDSQKSDLRSILIKHEELFNGRLGLYPHRKIHIDVDENALPSHSRPYPVPHVHLGTFKRELDHLCAIGVPS